jgi:hypothetical protein
MSEMIRFSNSNLKMGVKSQKSEVRSQERLSFINVTTKRCLGERTLNPSIVLNEFNLIVPDYRSL